MSGPATEDAKRKEARLSFNKGKARLFGEVLLEERIPSRLSIKNELIAKVLDILKERGLLNDKASLARWRLCLDEALVNAIVHGNNGDPRRFVTLKLVCGKSRWGILVEDEGKGFSREALSRARSPQALYAESGRGILLMRQFADEIRYYRDGASVLLVKTLSGTGGKRKKPPCRTRGKTSGKSSRPDAKTRGS